ncbi:hypothetical protein DUZ99_01935 [Xylanibacillus composti]|uniref:Tail fiber protein n=1 Tax=Xylanibacillus composti TaxID=1572762 RepID=A0A8J4M453_9BACL|nr:phage tail protein [Xylanibacillus composti]MDT9723754.1 hypothetical protein [Xylanibacillus composti]GIQ70777.1 hypothetical protein XYCOK13_36010 [Xylanibacillus composti]
MAKTDWTLDEDVLPQDMNNIGQEINQLRADVDNIHIPPASTTQAGIVQLSNAVNSTAQDMAATPAAVKVAYDRAQEAFQLGNERKQEVVDVLIAKGVSASTSESWDSLIGKLSSIIKATGNAAVGDVLVSKTFSNASANGLTGTMPNRGNVTQTLTSQGQSYTIPQGHHGGTGTVTANITNLSAANIRNGATVGGIAGTFSQFSNGATAAQILTGRSAAVNGAAVNGSMPDRGSVGTQTISTQNGEYAIPAGYHNGAGRVRATFANLTPANVRQGVNIGGVVGSLIPGVPYAEGSATPNQFGEIVVTGLSFRPRTIFISGDYGGSGGETINKFYGDVFPFSVIQQTAFLMNSTGSYNSSVFTAGSWTIGSNSFSCRVGYMMPVQYRCFG